MKISKKCKLVYFQVDAEGRNQKEIQAIYSQFIGKVVPVRNKSFFQVNGQVQEQAFVPTRNSFEVIYRTILLHSKLQLGQFPSVQKIILLLKRIFVQEAHDPNLTAYEEFKLKPYSKEQAPITTFCRFKIQQTHRIPKCAKLERFYNQAKTQLVNLSKDFKQWLLESTYLNHKPNLQKKYHWRGKYGGLRLDSPNSELNSRNYNITKLKSLGEDQAKQVSKNATICAKSEQRYQVRHDRHNINKEGESVAEEEQIKKKVIKNINQFSSQALKLQQKIVKFQHGIKIVKQQKQKYSKNIIRFTKHNKKNIRNQDLSLQKTQPTKKEQEFIKRSQKLLQERNCSIQEMKLKSSKRIPPYISYIKPKFENPSLQKAPAEDTILNKFIRQSQQRKIHKTKLQKLIPSGSRRLDYEKNSFISDKSQFSKQEIDLKINNILGMNKNNKFQTTEGFRSKQANLKSDGWSQKEIRPQLQQIITSPTKRKLEKMQWMKQPNSNSTFKARQKQKPMQKNQCYDSDAEIIERSQIKSDNSNQAINIEEQQRNNFQKQQKKGKLDYFQQQSINQNRIECQSSSHNKMSKKKLYNKTSNKSIQKQIRQQQIQSKKKRQEQSKQSFLKRQRLPKFDQKQIKQSRPLPNKINKKDKSISKRQEISINKNNQQKVNAKKQKKNTDNQKNLFQQQFQQSKKHYQQSSVSQNLQNVQYQSQSSGNEKKLNKKKLNNGIKTKSHLKNSTDIQQKKVINQPKQSQRQRPSLLSIKLNVQQQQLKQQKLSSPKKQSNKSFYYKQVRQIKNTRKVGVESLQKQKTQSNIKIDVLQKQLQHEENKLDQQAMQNKKNNNQYGVGNHLYQNLSEICTVNKKVNKDQKLATELQNKLIQKQKNKQSCANIRSNQKSSYKNILDNSKSSHQNKQQIQAQKTRRMNQKKNVELEHSKLVQEKTHSQAEDQFSDRKKNQDLRQYYSVKHVPKDSSHNGVLQQKITNKQITNRHPLPQQREKEKINTSEIEQVQHIPKHSSQNEVLQQVDRPNKQNISNIPKLQSDEQLLDSQEEKIRNTSQMQQQKDQTIKSINKLRTPNNMLYINVTKQTINNKTEKHHKTASRKDQKTQTAQIRKYLYGRQIDLTAFDKCNKLVLVNTQLTKIKVSQLFTSFLQASHLRDLKIQNCKYKGFYKGVTAIIQSNFLFIERIIQQSPETGVYGFWLCNRGKWQCQVVDQFVSAGECCTLSSGEFWCSLLQKALTKQFDGLGQVTSREVIQAITGSPVMEFKVRENPRKNKVLNSYIQKNYNRNVLMLGESYNQENQLVRLKSLQHVVVKGIEELVYVLEKVNGQIVNLKEDQFCSTFKFVLGVNLRLGYFMSNTDFQLGRGKTSVTKFRMGAPGTCILSLFVLGHKLSYHEDLPLAVSLKLYQEVQAGVLRKVGESRFKKGQNSFEVSLKSSFYFLFVSFESRSQFVLDYRIYWFGESQVQISDQQEISSQTFQNTNSHYAEADNVIFHKKQNKLRDFQLLQ